MTDFIYNYINDDKIDEELKSQVIYFKPLINPIYHIKCNNSFCGKYISILEYKKCLICLSNISDIIERQKEFKTVQINTFVNELNKSFGT